eukprot:CAMPEP_0204822992 /NCGR_PEP_ID=MMETSP1346-20131115/1170_1 /ASSEMBLY_ACC=CAM_ASM_000771 /TAXON_ID=215587 /ORGANISM="Aplanochytrium stocchinoi, Strain GSBS06" /LENGTH=143 /DNA_ID=CAMNT_0051949515 /DNA_START=308 /DNA_END=739 /DNA_ORIENTATION=-
MSGINATPEAVAFYNEFKLQRHKKGVEKHRFVIYRIVDDSKIEVSEKGAWDSTWDDFVDRLLNADGQGVYGIFDYDIKVNDRALEKIVFVAYSPDNLPIRQRMLYGATRESFKSELGDGLHLVIQATGLADLEQESVEKKLSK